MALGLKKGEAVTIVPRFLCSFLFSSILCVHCPSMIKGLSKKQWDMEKWHVSFYFSIFQWFPTNKVDTSWQFVSLWLFWLHNICWRINIDHKNQWFRMTSCTETFVIILTSQTSKIIGRSYYIPFKWKGKIWTICWIIKYLDFLSTPCFLFEWISLCQVWKMLHIK